MIGPPRPAVGRAPARAAALRSSPRSRPPPVVSVLPCCLSGGADGVGLWKRGRRFMYTFIQMLLFCVRVTFIFNIFIVSVSKNESFHIPEVRRLVYKTQSLENGSVCVPSSSVRDRVSRTVQAPCDPSPCRGYSELYLPCC